MQITNITNKFQAEQHYKHVGEELEKFGVSTWIKGDSKTKQPMTKKQRGSLHVWCQQYADALNEGGLLRKVHRINGSVVDVPWTMIAFKEDVYKVMLEALTKKSSTEDQNTVEPSDVAKNIGLHFAQSFGVTEIPWPSNR